MRRRGSALSGRRSVIGEGHREVRGESAAGKGKDALGGLRSGILRVRGLQGAPSQSPSPARDGELSLGGGGGARDGELSLGAPPLPAGGGSAGVAGPCSRR